MYVIGEDNHNVVKVSSKMLSFVVLAKKNFGANPIIKNINKPRLTFGHAPLHFASVQQDFSESVNQPLQRHHAKGLIFAHMWRWGPKEHTHMIFIEHFKFRPRDCLK